MKKLFTFTVCILFMTGICQAQDSLHSVPPNNSMEQKSYSTPQVNSKDYFLAKSSRMQTTGWVLIGVGAALGVSGYFIYQNNQDASLDHLGDIYAGYFAMIGGSVMVAVGIPVLIKSGYYNRKAMAMSASINIERYQSGLAVKQFPAVGLNIRF